MSCGLHDAEELEAAGVPTVVICTEAFVPSVREQLATFNFPDYEAVFVEHPVAALPAEIARARGRTALADVVRVLSGGQVAVPAEVLAGGLAGATQAGAVERTQVAAVVRTQVGAPMDTPKHGSVEAGATAEAEEEGCPT